MTSTQYLDNFTTTDDVITTGSGVTSSSAEWLSTSRDTSPSDDVTTQNDDVTTELTTRAATSSAHHHHDLDLELGVCVSLCLLSHSAASSDAAQTNHTEMNRTRTLHAVAASQKKCFSRRDRQ